MRALKNIMVTGGAGFIGSNFIRYLFNLIEQNSFHGRVINYDLLTYAGNPLSLQDIAETHPQQYQFVHGDICDRNLVEKTLQEYDIDCIVHFAAESHVDRSITGPKAFVQTNLVGTFTLLDAARSYWQEQLSDKLFHHVSTDEVYGSLGSEGLFQETTPYDPRSPYSASKAGSDHLARAWYHTYGLPLTLSNCSNNYGPYHFPEKLIPLMIHNALQGRALPVYGKGENIRDWLYVEDHAKAIWRILQDGQAGRSYNIGGENEWRNIDLVYTLCDVLAEQTGQSAETYKNLVTFVKDRPGHDKRYAIDCSRIRDELGWQPEVDFREGLSKTIAWYLNNQEWVEQVSSGEYRQWIEKNYEKRE